ncbi:HisA/HisF-related TIM barrel protein [Schlesneria sp. T3-172]|uniref:HisA/HisF-related TIM barrel protein n=1 Tax=Schlesneria sphaerica TaxID=3373610 RepID=UPI0037CB13A9
MQVLPVLDILGGEVVRGVAGRRAEYRRIESRLSSSSDPVSIARRLRESFGFDRFYVADLDGIMQQKPHYDVYRHLCDERFKLLIDAGVCDFAGTQALARAGDVEIVLGLETTPSPQSVRQLAKSVPNITFSLDLLNGVPRFAGNVGGWSQRPQEIAAQVVEAGGRSLIVLDLADVGMSTGGSTDLLCRFIRREFPDVELISGGGVRSRSDLLRFRELGVDSVLVASALHDGRLDSTDLCGL